MTRLGTLVDQPSALIGFQRDQIADLNAAGAGKAEHGLGRLTGRIEGGLERGTASFDLFIGLVQLQVGDMQCQTPRGTVAHTGIKAQAGTAQALEDTLGEGVHQGAQGFGRQFFGAQLNQKIGLCHHFVSPAAAASLAITSSRKAAGAWGKPSFRRESK